MAVRMDGRDTTVNKVICLLISFAQSLVKQRFIRLVLFSLADLKACNQRRLLFASTVLSNVSINIEKRWRPLCICSFVDGQCYRIQENPISAIVNCHFRKPHTRQIQLVFYIFYWTQQYPPICSNSKYDTIELSNTLICLCYFKLNRFLIW